MSQTPPISSNDLEKLTRLRERYAAEGQDLGTHLDGLLQTEFTNYWDYIRLDTLLSLQTPRTAYPDEVAFIIYHQVSELYFKLCLHELEQLSSAERPNAAMVLRHVGRVTGCLRALTDSFSVVSAGMDPEQFRRFRLALAPASGFQSVQYRMIEIAATDLANLTAMDRRQSCQIPEQAPVPSASEIPGLVAGLYWQQADPAGGPKTLSLRQFNKRYDAALQTYALTKATRNVWRIYLGLDESERADPSLVKALRDFDAQANLHWPLAHFKTALMHLGQGPSAPQSTAGLDWRRYLPPQFQRRIFYPSLWTAQERAEWGRSWVEANSPA